MVNSSDAVVEDLSKESASNVRVRYLIDERQDSNHFSLRLYTVEKNGHRPLDQHEYEHQVYILQGQGSLKEEKSGSALRDLREGDSIFIPSNAVHQFINERDEPLVFLCVKGSPRIYQPDSSNTETSMVTRSGISADSESDSTQESVESTECTMRLNPSSPVTLNPSLPNSCERNSAHFRIPYSQQVDNSTVFRRISIGE
jgi:quercetin dioxygenase-like cupin family protein